MTTIANGFLVPQSKDGSCFLPNVATRNGFRVGYKGDEWVEKDYFDALRALSKMPTPHWRRKNAAGNQGIVSGITWISIPKPDIEAML